MRDERADACRAITSLCDASDSIHASTSVLKVSTSAASLANEQSASYRTLVDFARAVEAAGPLGHRRP